MMSRFCFVSRFERPPFALGQTGFYDNRRHAWDARDGKISALEFQDIEGVSAPVTDAQTILSMDYVIPESVFIEQPPPPVIIQPEPQLVYVEQALPPIVFQATPQPAGIVVQNPPVGTIFTHT
ncbi:hypothetical protein Baya_1446 [Bagarius yarrelli]|uniref:Uncharacterized protein n=1 Tax=Bagarius yarrelli TaxID=175774 RepID=A0A556TL48_BAGYA|nr:hypothetical protein Baya_1446 [Bagarius yarrelli]